MHPIHWDVRRQPRRWTREEQGHRFEIAPEKIEYVNGIFSSDRQRVIVLGLLLENLGMDKALEFGKLEDWKAAIADRENKIKADQ
jgi:hypothetical protein